MLRFLVLMTAALSLAVAPVSAATPKKKPAAATSHTATKKGSTKKTTSKAESAKGHGAHHAKGEEGGDEGSSGCAPAKSTHGKHSAHKPAGCSSSAHKKGHEDAGDSSDEGAASDCKPAHGSHGRGRHASSCHSGGESHGRKVHCAPVKHGKGKHGKRKCVVVEPPLPPPVFSAPRPPVINETTVMPSGPQPYSAPSSPDSAPPPSTPASTPKRGKPGVGTEVKEVHAGTTLDAWGARRRAERASHPAAAQLTQATLVGRTDAELRTTLGAPELTRAEGDGAMYTYRLPGCALLVFLHKAEPSGYKVTGAQAGPLSRGGATPDVDACLKSAATATPAPAK
jgi:hypothetical protein